MSNVLIIESSARQQDSISRQLTQQFISQWQAARGQQRLALRRGIAHIEAEILAGRGVEEGGFPVGEIVCQDGDGARHRNLLEK